MYLTISIPIIFSFIFLILLTSTPKNLNLGICQFDPSSEVSQIYQSLELNVILLNQENCTQNLIQQIKDKELNLGLVINRDFTNNLRNLKQGKIDLYYDKTNFGFASTFSWKIDLLLEAPKKQIIDNLNNQLKARIEIINPQIQRIDNQIDRIPFIQEEYLNLRTTLLNIENLETEYLVNPIRVVNNEVNNYDQFQIIFTYIFPIVSFFLMLMLSSLLIIYDKKN